MTEPVDHASDIEEERAPVTEGARGVSILERMVLDPVTQEPRPRTLPVDPGDHGGRLTREQKQAISEASLRAPKPPWLKIKLPGGGRYAETAAVVREHGLHTI